MLEQVFFPETKDLQLEFNAAVEAATKYEDPEGVLQAAAAAEGLAVASRKTAFILIGISIVVAVGAIALWSKMKWDKKLGWLKYLIIFACIIVAALGLIMFFISRAVASKWAEAAKKTEEAAKALLAAPLPQGIVT